MPMSHTPEPPGDAPVTDPDPPGRRRRRTQWAGALTIEDFRSVRRWLVVIGITAVVGTAIADLRPGEGLRGRAGRRRPRAGRSARAHPRRSAGRAAGRPQPDRRGDRRGPAGPRGPAASRGGRRRPGRSPRAAARGPAERGRGGGGGHAAVGHEPERPGVRPGRRAGGPPRETGPSRAGSRSSPCPRPSTRARSSRAGAAARPRGSRACAAPRARSPRRRPAPTSRTCSPRRTRPRPWVKK